MAIDIIILAAGQGKRMRSKLPKCLHRIAGRPMLSSILTTARELGEARVHVVVAKGKQEAVSEHLPEKDINYVEQPYAGGTGHAVLQVLPHLDPAATALVLYGDVPLLQAETLNRLLHISQRLNALALLTMKADNPTGYGRILRDKNGGVKAIVEEADADDSQRSIDEVSTGIIAFPAKEVGAWLNSLDSRNAQGEIYLTDIIAVAKSRKFAIEAFCLNPEQAWEATGVNTIEQLVWAERRLYRQKALQLMAQGVRFANPDQVSLSGELQAGEAVYIDSNVQIIGRVELGSNVYIGANCILNNAKIGDNAIIKPFSMIEDSTLGNEAVVGPFARLRVGTQLADGVTIGNFVETKQASLGSGSKANHLSYIGDAELGEQVNIGAGVITCNYDGQNKHKTTIGNGAFIGSNTSLVAPIEVGENAMTAAGSAVTKDIPPAYRGFGRARQVNKPARSE